MDASGVRLTTDAPAESSDEPACTQGCVTVDAGANNGSCDTERPTPTSPITTFLFVVPDVAWGRDRDSSETFFDYWAALKSGQGSFAQPKMQVTYFYNDGLGSTYVERFGTPCPCAIVHADCPMNTTGKREFKKTVGGNIPPTDEYTAGTLQTQLPAGSTVMVEVWGADGLGNSQVFSSVSYVSSIKIPYSPTNFYIRGSISPPFTTPSLATTYTCMLDNSDPTSPEVSRLDIVIPGNIQGKGLWYSQVGSVTSSQPGAAVSTVQASAAGNGMLTLDFTANPVPPGAIVTITFTASAPGTSVQSVQWALSAWSGGASYAVAETVPDALYTALLVPPPDVAGLAVTPQNMPGSGQSLLVNWNGPSSPDTQAITAYRVFRSTSAGWVGALVATVPPAGTLGIRSAAWHPVIDIVNQLPVPVFLDLGLTNGETYCYTIAAVNPVGVSATVAAVCGVPYADPRAPSSVTALAASRRVELAWTPAVTGTYPVSGYRIRRATCSGCGLAAWVTVANATTSVFSDTTVTNGAAYRYDVTAYDEPLHVSVPSPQAASQPAVNPPAGFAGAYDYAVAGVALQWAGSAGNVYPLSGYNVYRATCATCPLVIRGTSPVAGPAATVFVDTGVAVANAYWYAVAALSVEGATTATAMEGASAPAIKVLVPPAAPFGLDVTDAGAAALALQWSRTSNPAGIVDGYGIYRSTRAGSAAIGQIGTRIGQNATSYLDSGLLPGLRYYYRVNAFVAIGSDVAESAFSVERSGVLAPGVPAGLTGVPGDGVIRLSWTDQRPGQEVDLYGVYRSSGSPAWATVLVASIAASCYDDATVTNGIAYYYRVTAVNAAGEGPPSPMTAGLVPYKPPTAPGTLVGFSLISQTSLVWDPATPTTYPLNAYEIWRATTAGQETLRGSVGSSVSKFTDASSIVNGRTYFYLVRAVDAGGNPGPPSNEVAITPAIPPCPPPSLSGVSSSAYVELQWPIVDAAACAPASSLPLSGYRVYRSTFSGGGYQPIAWSVSSTATTYLDATVVPGTVYYYAIRSYDSVMPPNESIVPVFPFGPAFSPQFLGAPRIAATAPASLAVLAGTPGEHDGAVKLSWISSVPGTFQVLGYDVFRSTTVRGPETKAWVSGGDTAAYLDTFVTNLVFYYYRVVPVEDLGFAGDWSAVTATPFRDPAPPGALTIREGDSLLALGWTAPAATSYPVTAYRVSRATFPGIAGAVPVGPDPLWATTFADASVVNATGYWYHVQTYDIPGHLSYAFSAEVSGTPYAFPAAPAWLTASSAPAGAALAWVPSVPTTYPVSAYQVLRGLSAGVGACSTCSVASIWNAAASVWTDSGLVNGTRYFYAVRVRDVLGHWGSAGNEASVVPAAVPCPPVALTALAVAPTQVYLTWPPVLGPCAPPSTFAVSGYVVYRATSAGASVAAFTVTVDMYATAYTDASAVAGETYYYRVRSFDKGVPVNEGTVFSPEADATPRVPAAAPAGLTVLHDPFEHDTKVKLTWNASVAGSLPVIGYNVYRASCSACPQGKVFGPGSAATLAYLDTGLANGAYYYYRVAPVEAKFFEGNWATVAGTPYADPPAPGSLTIREGDSQLAVGWSVPAPTTWAVTAYRVSRATWPGITGLAVLTPDPWWSTTFTDTGLVDGQAYYYHVQTYDIFRHLSYAYSAEVSGTPFAPPTAPLNVTAAPGDSRILLSWDPGSAGTYPVSGYAIFRTTWTGQPCGGTPYRTVCCGELELIDTGMPNDGKFYFYRVAAFDAVSAAHISPCTAEVSSSTYSTIEPPGKPLNLAVSATPGLATLGWQPASATTRPVSGYTIFRATYAGNPALALQRVNDVWGGAAGVAYGDASVQSGYVYYYRIRTRDDNTAVPVSAAPYVSEASNEASAFPATAPLALTAGPGSSQIFLEWNWTQAAAGGLGVTGYRVFRSTGAAGPFGLVHTTVAYPYATSWTDPVAPPGRPFYYEVAALHELGWASVPSGTVLATSVGPPSAPALAVAPGDGRVVLGWNACTSPFPPVTTYVVFRGTYAGFPANGVPRGMAGPAAAPPLTYTDTGAGVSNGIPYYYRVAAVDSSSVSASTYSNEAFGLPLGVAVGVASTPGDGSITLGWSPPADPGGISGYFVYRRSLVQPEGVAATVFGAAPAGWTDAPVQNGVAYYYRLRAFDSVTAPTNRGAFSAEALGLPATPPGSPSITFIAPGDRQIDLCWGPPASPGTYPVSGYRLFRSSGGGPYALRAALLSGSCFTDFPVTNGVTWYYKVAAFDSLVPPVQGPLSNAAFAVPYALPTAPLAVTAYAMPGTILLGWSTAFVQSTYPVAGWNLYRGTAPGAESPTPVNGAAITATFYADTGLVNGTRYWYVLRTVDVPGHASAPSAEIAAAPFIPPGSPSLALTPGDRQVALGWTSVTGTFTPITTYAVYRATYAGFTPGAALVRLTGAAPPVAYTDLNVTNGLPYYYRVGAIDSDSPGGRHETRSAERYVLVLGIPLFLSAMPGDTRVTLLWAPPAAAGQAGISGYFVYRRDQFVAEARVGTVFGPGASGYVDAAPPLSNGVVYYYRVAAFDSATPPVNVGPFSPTAQATPGNGPSAPTINVITAGFQRVDLRWSPPSVLGSNPLAGYRLYRSSCGGPYGLLASVLSSASSYGDAPLVNGSTLAYRVVAYDTVGIEGPPSNVKSAIPYAIPNPPGMLTVRLRSGSLYVGWATAYLSGSATVFVQTTFPPAGYVIFRTLVSNGPLPAPFFTTATGYVDTGLANGTTYFYKVATVDSGGHWSATSIEVSGAPYAPAGAPSGLSALPGNNVVMLRWLPGTAGTWVPVSGYNVYRGASSGAEVLLAGPVFATIFADTGVTNGAPVWYTVRARDYKGNPGTSSAEASETPWASIVNPPMSVAAGMGAGGIALSWGRTIVGSTPGGPTDRYLVVRSTCAACAFETALPGASTYVSSTVFAWTDTAAVPGRFYRYAVRSVVLVPSYSESADYPWSVYEFASACGPPNPPASIAAVPGSGAVSLSWTAPASTSVCQLPLMYRLYRSVNGGGTWLTLTNTGSIAFMDRGAVNGTAYVYRVTSVAATGVESATGATSAAVTPSPRASSAFLSRNAFAPLRGERLDIAYTLEREGPVTVRVYTISGLKVWERVVPSQPAGPSVGAYAFAGPDGFPGWDGKAPDGRTVASGVYLIEIDSGKFRKQMKVIVIK